MRDWGGADEVGKKVYNYQMLIKNLPLKYGRGWLGMIRNLSVQGM